MKEKFIQTVHNGFVNLTPPFYAAQLPNFPSLPPKKRKTHSAW